MLFSSKTYPELISLHIPKTAGTSFRNILKTNYGEEQVVRLDINAKGEIRVNEMIYHKKSLPDVRVIHGHFVYQDLIKNFKLPENYNLITWVRDPVERVVSNFYYLEARIKELLDEEHNNLNILSKLQRTLIEYARAEINRNRQTKFLTGSKLEDFDFIGICEFFEQELIRLSTVLNWVDIPMALYHNKTKTKEKQLPENVLNEIRELNKDDVHLYNEALNIRKVKMKN
jgi:hypothetical protein